MTTPVLNIFCGCYSSCLITILNSRVFIFCDRTSFYICVLAGLGLGRGISRSAALHCASLPPHPIFIVITKFYFFFLIIKLFLSQHISFTFILLPIPPGWGGEEQGVEQATV